MTNVLNPPDVVQHRKARQARTKDSIVALDMFSGSGGSSQGIEAAGIDVWFAANHWEYAIDLHERNHPRAEHFIADLVNEEANDYYHPEQLPAADILWASPSCTNHSQASATKAYRRNLSLFDSHDEDYEAAVTHSERSRATAVCVLQYLRKHAPKVAVVENVVEFANWGFQMPNSRKGDGTTFRWWLREIENLGYEHRELFLNSQFFPPCPQSRDRMYVAIWQKGLRAPDLDHRPPAHCSHCDAEVESKQVFKARTRVWPLPEWGKYGDQYVYACPSCNREVRPYAMACASVIDWSDLGSRIGDREKPLADSTMARIARGVEKFSTWPSFVMPAKGVHGSDRHISQPLATQTGQQEAMLVNAMQVVVAGNTFEHPGSSCRTRSMGEPMWTQHTTAAHAMVVNPFMMTNRTNNVPTGVEEPFAPFATGGSHMLVSPFIDNYQGSARGMFDQLPTQAGTETHGLVAVPLLYTDRGTGGPGSSRPGKVDSLGDPMSTVAASGNHHFMLTPMFQHGAAGAEQVHPGALGVEPMWMVPPQGPMPPISVEDCLYRMLKPDEIKLGMGFAWEFEMWGTARNQVKALGNAVTPPVATWIMERMAALLR